MVKFIVPILLLLTLNTKLFALQIQSDSLKAAQIAVRDADKHFKLNRNIRKAYRQKNLSSTSDYFKPNLKTTRDPKFLADTNYVKVYRHTAFENTVYQIPLNRTKIVIVAVVVAGVVVTVVIIVKIAEKIGNAIAGLFGGLK